MADGVLFDRINEGQHLPMSNEMNTLRLAFSALASLLSLASAAAQAQAPRQGYITTGDGVRLAYRVLGEGPQTLVIPAGFSDQTDYSSLAHGRRVLLYDQRDRGRSDTINDPKRIGLNFELQDLEALRTQLGSDRISLMGESYLGAVVALYAAAHPEHIDRLIQVDPMSPRRDPYSAQEDAIWAARLDQDAMKRLDEMKKAGLNTKDPVAYCREYDKTLLPYFGDRATLLRYHSRCELPNERPDHFDSWWDAMEKSFGKWDWRSRAALIKAPALVIYGDRDFIPAAATREWAACIPDARLLVLPGIGHISWFEASDKVISATDEFLGGKSPHGAIAVQPKISANAP